MKDWRDSIRDVVARVTRATEAIDDYDIEMARQILVDLEGDLIEELECAERAAA